jgi:hypothetical protein
MSTPTQDTPQLEVEQPVYEDYFGFAKTERWYFPDGKQYIEFEIMNEGKKAKFQKHTQRDLVLERNSGNARMKVDPSQERHELLRSSVTDWYLTRGGQPIPYTERAFKDFLELADPVLIEDLEKAVRKANPWLMAEMSVEDIDREIENLQEMRKIAEERERGNVS